MRIFTRGRPGAHRAVDVAADDDAAGRVEGRAAYRRRPCVVTWREVCIAKSNRNSSSQPYAPLLARVPDTSRYRPSRLGRIRHSPGVESLCRGGPIRIAMEVPHEERLRILRRNRHVRSRRTIADGSPCAALPSNAQVSRRASTRKALVPLGAEVCTRAAQPGSFRMTSLGSGFHGSRGIST